MEEAAPVYLTDSLVPAELSMARMVDDAHEMFFNWPLMPWW
jgi:hypothetical protein